MPRAKKQLRLLMERRLLRAIINPAMIVTWVAGLWLVIAGPPSPPTCAHNSFG